MTECLNCGSIDSNAQLKIIPEEFSDNYYGNFHCKNCSYENISYYTTHSPPYVIEECVIVDQYYLIRSHEMGFPYFADFDSNILYTIKSNIDILDKEQVNYHLKKLKTFLAFK